MVPGEPKHVPEDEEPDGHDGGGGGGAGGIATNGGADGAAGAAALPSADQVANARLVLLDFATRTGDDNTVRLLRKRLREEAIQDQHAKCLDAQYLIQRGKKSLDEDAKRHKQASDDANAAAKNIETLQTAKALQQKLAQRARLKCLERKAANDRLHSKQQKALFEKNAYEKWLQTKYAVIVASNLVRAYGHKSPEQKAAFQTMIKNEFANKKTFSRTILLFELWPADERFTHKWGTSPSPLTQKENTVHCGLDFQEFIDKYAPLNSRGFQHPLDSAKGKGKAGTFAVLPKSPLQTLWVLFEKIIGPDHVRKIFSNNHYPTTLLHTNDFCMEKTFLAGVICLSKWLGKDNWPEGLHGNWPPRAPDNLVLDEKNRGSLLIQPTT